MAGDRIEQLEAEVAELRARVDRLVEMVAERDARIVELEGKLSESRRAGKRQAAPFRKGDGPVDDPAKPGRKRGKNHGRHGHRAAPTTDPDRVLDAPVGSCGCGGHVVVSEVQADLVRRR